MKTCTLSA